MKASCVEGIANHNGPESCGAAREGGVEALTGERTGRVLSREIHALLRKRQVLRDADAVEESGRQHRVHRHRKVCPDLARSETPCMYVGSAYRTEQAGDRKDDHEDDYKKRTTDDVRRAADIEFSENRRASRPACSGRPKTQGGSKGSPTGTLDRPHESRKIPLVPQSKLLCEPKVAQESHSHSEAQKILCWLSRLRGRAVQRSAPDSLSLGRFRFVCRNKLDV
jgi:hypothetical protein